MLRREYCGESFQIFRKDLLRSNQITKGQFFAMRSYQLKNAVFTTLGVGTTSRRVFRDSVRPSPLPTSDAVMRPLRPDGCLVLCFPAWNLSRTMN
jgi:hypothetical protein